VLAVCLAVLGALTYCALVPKYLGGLASGSAPAPRAEPSAPALSVSGTPVAGMTPTWRSPNPAPLGEIVEALVIRVVDGDTAVMRLDDGREERVRFIGVDTPEIGAHAERYGEQAAAYTTRVLAGRRVFLEGDVGERDRYGRLLSYVWLARPTSTDEPELRARMLNARLLLDGFAYLMTIPPDVKYVGLFTEFATEARQAQRGLWGTTQ